ncbi:MAG TPA: LysE family translocator [Bacillota bacterium]|nr:LysE family translocator [Bacillota bacterium]
MAGFISYILISIFTPGPNNIFASVSTVKSGFKKTMPFMLGVLVGTFIIFVIAGMFNVYLYENIKIITEIIGIVGGLFIIYLAIKMILERKETEKSLINNDRFFITAILLNFVNAKTIVFGLTVSTFYLEMDFPSKGMIWFAAIMSLLCFVSVIVWGVFGKIFREWLVKYHVIFNLVMGALLGYSGIIIIIESLS